MSTNELIREAKAKLEDDSFCPRHGPTRELIENLVAELEWWTYNYGALASVRFRRVGVVPFIPSPTSGTDS